MHALRNKLKLDVNIIGFNYHTTNLHFSTREKDVLGMFILTGEYHVIAGVSRQDKLCYL